MALGSELVGTKRSKSKSGCGSRVLAISQCHMLYLASTCGICKAKHRSQNTWLNIQ